MGNFAEEDSSDGSYESQEPNDSYEEEEVKEFEERILPDDDEITPSSPQEN